MFPRILRNSFPGLMVASVPFAGWSLMNIGNAFSFTASYVIGLCVLMLNLPHLVQLIQKPQLHRHFLAFYAPLIMACLVSALPLQFWEYGSSTQYLISLLHLCFFIAITHGLLKVTDTYKALDFYALAYTATAVLVALVGLYDFALIVLTGSGLGIEFNTVARQAPSDTTLGMLPRASSVFFEPGWFAHYLLIDIVVVAVWLLPRARWSCKRSQVWVLRGILMVMLAALVVTLSASAFAVSAVTLLFYILNRPRPLRTLSLLALMVLLLSLVPLPNEMPNPLASTFERFAGLATGEPVAGESAGTRREEIEGALQMLTSTLLLGGGYGQSAYFISTVANTGTMGISSFYGILLAETGMLGLLAFGVSILALNYKLWRLHKKLGKQDPRRAQIVFCCRIVLLAETVFLNFFSAMASSTYICSFWFALLLLNGWSQQRPSLRSPRIEDTVVTTQ